MKTKRQLQIAQRKRFQPQREKEIIARMGNRDGDVDAGNGYSYVKTFDGQTLTVYNGKVPNIRGRLVKLKMEYGEYVIVGYWNIYNQDPHEGLLLLPEHDHNYWTSNNPTWISIDQILPLLVAPYSGMTVQVYEGQFRKKDNSGIGSVATQTIDLSSYRPASGAIYVVIETDDDGILSVTSGSAVDGPEDLTLADIPEAAGIGLCAVRLHDGQEELFRNKYINDFVDLRSMIWYVGGDGGSGGAFQRILSADLTLVNGECLVITGYLDAGSYVVDCQGDAEVCVL